jgi:hypothetical protein
MFVFSLEYSKNDSRNHVLLKCIISFTEPLSAGSYVFKIYVTLPNRQQLRQEGADCNKIYPMKCFFFP